MNILHIDSSINGAASVSRQLGAAIVGQLQRRSPGAALSYVDLAATPLPQLAAAAPAPAALAASLDAFMAADVVVIGAPMYNFAIPSQLKTWVDSICVAGATFSYSAAGAVGLCGGKRVIIASARGNVYTAPSPMAAFDHQETYLRDLFGFIGVTQIDVVRAEGVAFGAEPRQQAMDAALAQVEALTA